MSISRWISAAICMVSLTLAACSGDEGQQLIGNNSDNNVNNQNSQNSSELKVEGEPCLEGDECSSGVCRFGTCTGGSCVDGILNGDETDIDCGALGCRTCAIGGSCEEDIDCISGICNDNICRDKNCADGEKNGLETDVDCGGTCGPCADGQACAEVSDCISNVCDDEVCATPNCDDDENNGDETDVDCGGPCDPCVDGQVCSTTTDCTSGVCTGGLCTPPTCSDSVANGQETDTDCGGPTCMPCADGAACSRTSDCISGVCGDFPQVCEAPGCFDNVLNGDETDRDCGGSCAVKCTPGRACMQGSDCETGVCDTITMTCSQPTCEDNVTNGEETDVDCGGRCTPCEDGDGCEEASDCLSFVCMNDMCAPSNCNDGAMNGTETDVDCGGTCNKCADNDDCSIAADCQSNVCTNGRCTAPRCNDGVINGQETDVDCGGTDCNACADLRMCSFGADCVSLNCVGGTCIGATCQDAIQNGGETDVDCGGPDCPKCVAGDSCANDVDCDTSICDGGPVQGPICAVCDENRTQTIQFACGFKGRGVVEQTCQNGVWVNTDCVDEWFATCAEVLANDPMAQDGNYAIDPDGPANEYSEFQAFCDMTTDGGGWTEILPCNAQNNLQGELVAVQQAEDERLSSCKPETRDEAGLHSYHYTFDFPGQYSQFILHNYEAKANADTGQSHTSDFGHVMLNWNQGNGGTTLQRGDIGFGSANQTGPRHSYSQFYGFYSCGDCVVGWTGPSGPISINGTSTKFRLGWGESGPEHEGWFPWWSGAIRLR